MFVFYYFRVYPKIIIIIIFIIIMIIIIVIVIIIVIIINNVVCMFMRPEASLNECLTRHPLRLASGSPGIIV